jgi:hypothetical protein
MKSKGCENMIIKGLKIIIFALLSIILLFVFIVIRLYAIKINDIRLQERHMNQIRLVYQNDQYEAIEDADFMNFELTPDIRLNEIQMLASHNSYKKRGVPLGKLFVGLGDSFEEADALKYGYQDLTRQFSFGVRSMEFDLRLRKTSFMLTHVPLVDNSSVAPDFSKALEEMRLYSVHNPNHLPIIILMEIKDDWMILDHALQVMDTTDLENLDELIRLKLGNTLFTPSQMMNDGMGLKASIDASGWPSVESLLGKIIFVLHPGSFTDRYASLDSTNRSQAMFIGLNKNLLEREYASFVVHNEPDIDVIQAMVSDGLMVRTRLDDRLVFDEDRYQRGIESGAQILTTDLIIGRSDIQASDVIYLDNKKMIIIRNNG